MPHRRLAELYGDRDLPVHRTTLLALMFAAGALLCLLAVLFSLNPIISREILFGAASIGSVVAVTLWSRRRRRVPLRLLQAALMLFSLLVAIVAAHATAVNDVTSLGPAVIMTCAYAGCFYSRRALWIQIAASVGSYCAAAAFSAPNTAWTSVATACCVGVALAVVLHQLTSLLRRRSQLDQLTGAVSRAAWMKIAEDALQSRGSRPATVAMLDLDKFKLINDRLGHLAGDDLLRAISQAWQESLGGEGLLGRYGGDEFVILFVDTDADHARKLLTKLELIQLARWTTGMATARPGDDLSTLLDRVDRRLRQNKVTPMIPRQTSPSDLDLEPTVGTLRPQRDLSRRP